jgi:hypothetical protein
MRSSSSRSSNGESVVEVAVGAVLVVKVEEGSEDEVGPSEIPRVLLMYISRTLLVKNDHKVGS